MTVRDFYFKFQDAASAAATLGELGFYRRADGELAHESRAVSVDEIGVVHAETGEFSIIDGEQVAVIAPVGGHHVNIRSLDQAISDKLSAISSLVSPKTPVRKWA
ncbi:MAG: hypothetical protein ACRCXB_25575 [Aeromonadaceae bacterium]